MGNNTKHKDRLFRFIFGNPDHKEWTLSLYNALNGSHYDDPEAIIFNTIEDAVYMGMKNDTSFIMTEEGTMNLWEHQSSFNPYLPVRMLIYVAQLYDKYLDDEKIYRYGAGWGEIPAAVFLCFYKGTDSQPEERILRLSDLFGGKKSSIEASVRMLNINYGRNRALMEECRPLEEYAWFIGAIRRHQKTAKSLEEAIDSAVDEMPGDLMLKRFLLGNRAKVKGMYLTEYSAEKERQRAKNEIVFNMVANMLRENLPLTLIKKISNQSEDAILSIATSLGISVHRG